MIFDAMKLMRKIDFIVGTFEKSKCLLFGLMMDGQNQNKMKIFFFFFLPKIKIDRCLFCESTISFHQVRIKRF